MFIKVKAAKIAMPPCPNPPWNCYGSTGVSALLGATTLEAMSIALDPLKETSANASPDGLGLTYLLLHRKGKKAVATLFSIDQWRFHKRLRTVTERHFAWAKRYFDLNDSRCQGCVAITQHVALAAERYGRPHSHLSRKGVLAAKTP
jgi:hypothetical protein